MKRIVALDVIRGFAVLGVLLRHASNETFPMAGVIGVNLFFVLSGFLNSGILINHIQQTGRLNFGKFFRNHATRLFPALFLFVLFLGHIAFATPRV